MDFFTGFSKAASQDKKRNVLLPAAVGAGGIGGAGYLYHGARKNFKRYNDAANALQRVHDKSLKEYVNATKRKDAFLDGTDKLGPGKAGDRLRKTINEDYRKFVGKNTDRLTRRTEQLKRIKGMLAKATKAKTLGALGLGGLGLVGLGLAGRNYFKNRSDK